jgi:outer membrane receptor protein involved in Fe transport
MAGNRYSSRIAAAVATALGLSAPVGAVFAQAVAADGTVLEEIVVTATRREANVQDVPFNMVALGPETLEALRITNLSEFTRAVPGLYVANQGPRGSNLMTVRGLNVSSINASESVGNGTGGTVATYLGEIPLFVDLKMIDMERVEALLGPQGTLYGSGTLGGAIRYLPNRPDTSETALEIGGRTYALGQSDGIGYDLHGVVNVPLVEDQLAVRLAVGYTDDPGFIDYNYIVREPGVSDPEPDRDDPAAVAANLRKVEDADSEETLTGRAALLWNITDAVTANLTYFYQQQDVGARTVNHDLSFDTGRYVSGHRFLEPNDKKNQLLALELTWDLGFADLTSATGTSKFESNGQRDQTDLLMDFDYGYEDFPQFAAYTREDQEEKTFNQEVRLVSQGTQRWNWIAGAFYNKFEGESSSQEFTPGIPDWYGFPPGTPDLEYLATADETFEEMALFGEIGFHFTEAWQATVGARWFDYDDDVELQTAFPFFADPPGDVQLSGVRNKTGDDDVIFKFNTSYDFNDDLMAYLTVSEGYRRGGVNSGPLCTGDSDGQSFCLAQDEVLIKPDTTTNYEVGLRSMWLDGRLIVNAAAYYIDWQDIQVLGTSATGGVPITVNGSAAESMGIELTTRWSITDHFELAANYTFNDAQLTEDAPGLVDGVDAFDGDRLAGTPEQQGTLLLAYTRPLDNGLTVTADYSLSAVSDVYTKVGLRDNGEALPGWAVHGLSFGLTDGRWSARLYADNLFDKYAVTSVRRDPSYIRRLGTGPDDVVPEQQFASRTYFQSMLRPRTVGLEFNYRFDL